MTAVRANRRNQPKDGTRTLLSVSGSKEAVEQAVARVHAIIADPPARFSHLCVFSESLSVSVCLSLSPAPRSLSLLHLYRT